MVEALPAKQRLGLAWALDQWANWTTDTSLSSRPEFIEILSNGISNHSFLVQSAKQQFVVRLERENISALNLNRKREWQAHSIAWQHKLAPLPVYQNINHGVFVSEYIPQTSYGVAPNIAKTAELLINIHKLPTLCSELDIIKQAKYYRELALFHQPGKKIYIEKIWNLFLAPAENAIVLCTEKVFCHNDLLRANRLLKEDKLIAIDWEYANMSDPFFDMAAIIEGDHLNQEETQNLFDIYTAENHIEKAEKRLILNVELYRYIDLLWHLATDI
tara:strand:- start:130 stop:951 length:822 start_codon:yes stop_codon:yes gene_type:complete